jgi:hypothetical protein
MYVEFMNPLSLSGGERNEMEIVMESLKSVEKDFRRVEKHIVEVEKRLEAESNEESIDYYRNEEFLLLEKRLLLLNKILLLQENERILQRSMFPAAPIVSDVRTR